MKRMEESSHKIYKNIWNIKCFSKLKLTYQICIFATFMFILIIVFANLVSFFLIKYSINEFYQSSNKILNMESSSQLSKYIQLQKHLVNNYFDEKYHKLKAMAELFQFVQQQSISIEQPYYCYKVGQFYMSLVKDQFCYGYFGINETTFVDDYFLQYTSLLTETISILDFRQPYYTQTSENMFLAMNNGSELKPSFNPHTRGWYIDHLENMKSNQEILWSKPYFSAASSIRFALTTNLSLLNQTLVGVLGQGQELTFMSTLQSEFIQFQMISQTDELIISPLYEKNVTTFYKIYDENDTHINKSQWEDLKHQLKYKEYTIANFDDQYSNSSYLLAVIKMQNPLTYLMLQMDDQQYKQSEARLLDYFGTYISEYTVQFFVSAIIFCIVFLSTQWIASNILKRDILNLMTLAKSKIYSEHFKKCILERQQIRYQNESFGLFRAYLRILQSSSHESGQKNASCEQLENYQYPEKQSETFNYIMHQSINQIQNVNLEHKNDILFFCRLSQGRNFNLLSQNTCKLVNFKKVQTGLEQFINKYISKIKSKELEQRLFY